MIQVIDVARVYGAVTEPVTLAQAKQHCRVDFADDDAYITTLITQTRRRIENYCNISIVSQTITATFSFTPASTVYSSNYITPYANYPIPYAPSYNPVNGPATELPYGPVVSVTSVSSIGSDNSVNALSAANFDYYIRGTNFQSIYIENCPYNNAVAVYTTGYTVVPDDLVLAILNEIAFRYEARGDSLNRYASQNVGVSEGANALLQPYIRFAWL